MVVDSADFSEGINAAVTGRDSDQLHEDRMRTLIARELETLVHGDDFASIIEEMAFSHLSDELGQALEEDDDETAAKEMERLQHDLLMRILPDLVKDYIEIFMQR